MFSDKRSVIRLFWSDLRSDEVRNFTKFKKENIYAKRDS